MPKTENLSKKALAEQIALANFNSLLFKKGVITESEYRKMIQKIIERENKHIR